MVEAVLLCQCPLSPLPWGGVPGRHWGTDAGMEGHNPALAMQLGSALCPVPSATGS